MIKDIIRALTIFPSADRNDDLQTLKITSDPDIDQKQESPERHWNVGYSQSVRVNIGVPTSLMAVLKQQVRWKKSFIEVCFQPEACIGKDLSGYLLYYIQTVMKFVRPYILFQALFILPFEGRYKVNWTMVAGSNVYWYDICS